MTTAIGPHVHFSLRVRQLPTLLLFLGFKLGLHRFLVVSSELPHEPGCTAEEGVLAAHSDEHSARWLHKS